MFIRFIGLMAMLLIGGNISGQHAAAVKVTDSKTNEAIAYAHVCFEGLKTTEKRHFVTDMEGKVPNEMQEPAKVAISYVGYETLYDTIQPGQDAILLLKPTVLNMSEVVITAQFTPEKADKSIYKINVINSKQIEQRAATNLGDLLNTESNMRLSQGGVMGTSLSLQGLTGENVKFLFDGVPVVGRLNGNIDLNQLNLYNADHVEIIEGPMSVIYGSNAIAGVVNIITKEHANSSFTGFAKAYIESVGVYNFNAGSSVRLKKNHFSLDFSRNFFDGFSSIETSRYLQWKPSRQYNLDVFHLYSGRKTRIKLSGQYFNELLLDKGALIAPYFETAFDNHYNTTRLTAKAEASYKFTADKQISLVGAYSNFDRKRDVYYNNLTNQEKNLAGGDTTIFGNYLLRAIYNQNFPETKINYQAGFDGNYEWNAGERITNGSQYIGDYAGFLSIKYEPSGKLSLQPGVRWIKNTKYSAPLVYSLNVKYELLRNTSLRISYARGFRAPSLKELYLNFKDPSHDIIGNPNLEAEFSHNVNMNLSYNRETSRTYYFSEIGLFYNFVDNIIWLNKNGAEITSYKYSNIVRFISQGVQANASVSFYPAISLKGGLSLVGRRFPDNTSNDAENKFRYSTDLSSQVTYKFDKWNASATANYKYTGRFPQLDPEGEFANQFIEGYHTLDVSVMKNLIQNKLSISVGGKNLLNVKDVQSSVMNGSAHSGGGDGSSQIAWGRTYFVQLSLNLNKY